MKVTVCQLHNNREQFEQDWAKLVTHTAASQSDLVLLPEMPFSHWLAGSREASEDAWRKAMSDHAAYPDHSSPQTVLAQRNGILGGELVFTRCRGL